MLLDVQNLKKHFPVTGGILSRPTGYVRAVDDISFSIRENEVLGLVGESGCGKSTAGRCVMGLMEPTAGRVLFEGNEVPGKSPRDRKAMRRAMQIIFQDPMSSLDPRMTVGSIVAEGLHIHGMGERRERMERVRDLLDMVGLPANVINRYPHEFSGGQCQRIGIARALALDPRLIVADEPVSALDVSIQAQIINLLVRLKESIGLSYLFISHDLSVVNHISDRIAVMYLGEIVEIGPADAVCSAPAHPYTRALLAALPRPALDARLDAPVHGDVPSPADPPPGCRFHTRCPVARESCSREEPALVEKEAGRHVKCPWV